MYQSNLPLDADLARADILLEEVTHVQVGGVPGQVADEDHLVGVLGLVSSESVSIHCAFLILNQKWFCKESFCVLNLINQLTFCPFKPKYLQNLIQIFPQFS